MKPLFTQLLLIILLIVLVSMSGCAQLPLTNYGQDALMKTFPDPASDSAGLYVFRDSANSGLLTKRLTLNGEVLGDSGMFVYYYKTLEPGTHTLSTQSEFGEHTITFDALAGKNTYIRQKIVRGVFIAGAELEVVNEREGKIGVSKCYLVHEGVLHEAIETKAPF
jgi:hypothetical protein